MNPAQLNLLPPEQAALLIRKKRFWKAMMWLSLGAAIVFVLVGFSGTLVGMIRSFANLEESGSADPSALAEEISRSLLIGMITLPLIALSALTFLVSLIRCLSLPKIPKA